MSNPPRTRLSRLIGEARKRAGLTQLQLAKRLGTTKQFVSDVERGARIPSQKLLLKLHQQLRLMGTTATEELLVWLTARSLAGIPNETTDADLDALERSLTSIENQFLPPSLHQRRLGSEGLTAFPEAFADITVVIGDRREVPAKSRADLIAHSLSASDLRFLMQVGLPKSTEIVSDKVFALMDDSYLAARFGRRHLLVVGSPAVNLAARRTNADSLFHFDVPAAAAEFESGIRRALASEDTKLEQASRFLASLNRLVGRSISPEDTSDALTSEELRRLTSALKRAVDPLIESRAIVPSAPGSNLLDVYRKGGVVDVISNTVHQLKPEEKLTDLGMISIGPNPFSGDLSYSCVFVAGVHAPGTAHALRILGDRSLAWLRDRPLGGVFKVTIDDYKDWPSRFDKATAEWLTPIYSVPDVSLRLEPNDKADSSLVSKVSARCMQFIQALLKPSKVT